MRTNESGDGCVKCGHKPPPIPVPDGRGGDNWEDDKPNASVAIPTQTSTPFVFTPTSSHFPCNRMFSSCIPTSTSTPTITPTATWSYSFPGTLVSEIGDIGTTVANPEEILYSTGDFCFGAPDGYASSGCFEWVGQGIAPLHPAVSGAGEAGQVVDGFIVGIHFGNGFGGTIFNGTPVPTYNHPTPAIPTPSATQTSTMTFTPSITPTLYFFTPTFNPSSTRTYWPTP